jgi:hypothetical protein
MMITEWGKRRRWMIRVWVTYVLGVVWWIEWHWGRRVLVILIIVVRHLAEASRAVLSNI